MKSTVEQYSTMSLDEATRIQNELREKVDVAERDLNIHLIGGADISLNPHETVIYAGIVVLSFPSLRPVAYSLIKGETLFPYVPGYLAFREVPALLKVWDQLKIKPDLLVIDGQGIAHPRRAGIACHFGTLTGHPALGCAKNILCGKFKDPDSAYGSSSPIIHNEQMIGYAFRSKGKTAPVIISPGHLLGMENSLQIMRKCTGKYRIPEPTRLAHELVNKFRKGELKEGFYEL